MVIDQRVIDPRSRFRGSLLGLACGDALGAPIEFMQPGHFDPVVDFRPGGVFRVEAGQWTDDTAMALCLADSLISVEGFDARDQMERYTRWYRDGYLSSSGKCFDIGGTTQQSIEEFERTGEPFSGPDTPESSGNGCLMRLAPVAMFFAPDVAEAVENACLSARTTHGARKCLDACRYFAWLLVRAYAGESKDDLLSPRPWPFASLDPKIAEVAAGSFRRKRPSEIKGSGYVVESLEAALWAFDQGDDFADCVRRAANLGDDTDTTAAVCGQLAGAHYGEEGIPDYWLVELHWTARIRAMADQLYELAYAGVS